MVRQPSYSTFSYTSYYILLSLLLCAPIGFCDLIRSYAAFVRLNYYCFSAFLRGLPRETSVRSVIQLQWSGNMTLYDYYVTQYVSIFEGFSFNVNARVGTTIALISHHCFWTEFFEYVTSGTPISYKSFISFSNYIQRTRRTGRLRFFFSNTHCRPAQKTVFI